MKNEFKCGFYATQYFLAVNRRSYAGRSWLTKASLMKLSVFTAIFKTDIICPQSKFTLDRADTHRFERLLPRVTWIVRRNT